MNRPKIICHILQSVDGNISSNVAFFLTGKEERLCSILAFEISILILDLCNVHQS